MGPRRNMKNGRLGHSADRLCIANRVHYLVQAGLDSSDRLRLEDLDNLWGSSEGSGNTDQPPECGGRTGSIPASGRPCHLSTPASSQPLHPVAGFSALST